MVKTGDMMEDSMVVLDDGETRILIHRIDIDEVEKIHEMFPETHCQHSYDCCGNWYASRAVVIHEDRLYNYALVRQSSFKNV